MSKDKSTFTDVDLTVEDYRTKHLVKLQRDHSDHYAETKKKRSIGSGVLRSSNVEKD